MKGGMTPEEEERSRAAARRRVKQMLVDHGPMPDHLIRKIQGLIRSAHTEQPQQDPQ